MHGEGRKVLTPEEITQEARMAMENILPQVSKQRYLKAYDDFIKWRAEKKVKSLSENVLITYFSELSKKLKPSSLWSIYSMLKSTINSQHDIDMKNYSKLTAFLKRQSNGFKSKKSKVFTSQDVATFLNEAPDEIYLVTKVVMIFGISGACTSSEITNIMVDDIKKHGNLLLVTLPNTKTKIVVNKYESLRPDNMETRRFFLNYQRGKCLKQVIGKNKIASMPKQIAQYLNLPSTYLYTGHCFRRSSATLLADSGADLTLLKRHGGWKSSAVAEGYIEESVENKTKICHKLTEAINIRPEEPRPGTSRDQSSVNSSNPIHHDEEHTVSPTFTAQDLSSQVTQNVSNLNIPGKNVSFSFKNCSNFTINFK